MRNIFKGGNGMIRFDIDVTDGASDLIIGSVGRADCPPDMAYGQYTKDWYVVHVCLSGCGIVKSSSGRNYVNGGDMFVIRPGETISFTTDPDDPWYYVWIAFNGKRASVFNSGGRLKKTPSGIGQHLLGLIEDGETSHDAYSAVMFNIIYHLYTKSTSSYDRIDEVKRFIKEGQFGFMTANDIAAKFHFERSYLHRIFKRRYGITVKQYMIDVKMARAKSFLERGESVYEVAYKSGYHSEFNFSRAFKEYYGIAPSNVKSEDANN